MLQRDVFGISLCLLQFEAAEFVVTRLDQIARCDRSDKTIPLNIPF